MDVSPFKTTISEVKELERAYETLRREYDKASKARRGGWECMMYTYVCVYMDIYRSVCVRAVYFCDSDPHFDPFPPFNLTKPTYQPTHPPQLHIRPPFHPHQGADTARAEARKLKGVAAEQGKRLSMNQRVLDR